MEKTQIESLETVEAIFSGTAKELMDFILSYNVDHAPRTSTPIGPSDYLTLVPSADEAGLLYVDRIITRNVRGRKGKKLRLDPNPPREGTIRIKQVIANLPRAEFICRPKTEACREMALELVGEIKRKGYDLLPMPMPAASAATREALDGVNQKDSGHFTYPPEQRHEIVKEYRADRAAGNIATKAGWAQGKGISDKTLNSYLKEFPE